MGYDIPTWRLYAMRFLYLITLVGLGPSAWSEMISPSGPWDPLHGVAFSFWSAYTALMALGIVYPLKMLPLLLLQLFYKSVWLLGVGLPLWQSDMLDPVAQSLVSASLIGIVLDLVIIPWRYLFRHYFVKNTNTPAM